jgi:tetratricopeptide (TPR) repeat protein
MFRRNEGNTINSLGVVYKNLGDVRRAIGCYEQALAIAREIGDRLGEGNAVGNLGIAYKRLGNNLKAIDFYEEQLRITREIGDRRGEGNALGNLANACSNLGRVQQAIEYYEQAIRVDREVGDQYGEGIDSGNLAGLLARQGRLTEALPYAEQAVQIYTRIGRTQNALEAQRLVAEIKASLPSLNSTDEDGEEVVACVTCGASLSEHGRANCSALEMRRAVAAGFHPTPEALMAIGAMYGWSLDETLESFLMDVRGLDSDWVLCPSCISRVKLLAARSH